MTDRPRRSPADQAARVVVPLVLAALCLSGCRRDMQDQPKVRPLQASRFFADGRSARPIPPNTIALSGLNEDEGLFTGARHGEFLESIPAPITPQLLHRGEQRFNIYCSPCHGLLGDGDGMVARRGFKQPANFHDNRLRQAPPGYVFQVITNGYGAMPDYRAQIDVADRWAIVAYVRALQLSRNATLADVTDDQRQKLEAQR